MAPRGELRIIAGRWRGRRLPVPSQLGLRPTTDRVRETLFNWLAPQIEGARCLDLFAGSGALGFEAASRGAREVVMLERSPAVVRVLEANVEMLGADQVQVLRADALRWLTSGARSPFDIVFLDPPFQKKLLESAFGMLARGGWLAAGSRVYLETASPGDLPPVPPNWSLARDKTAGQVRYALAVAGTGDCNSR